MAISQPLSFHDKLLPVQPVLREQFAGEEGSFYETLYQTIARFIGLRSPRETFTLQQSEQVSLEEMASNPVMLRFLQTLVLLKQPQQILEIGAFIGVSAMSMASVLPVGGRLVTIEKYDHFAAIANKNFAANRLADRIQLIQGDAFAELAKLNGRLFDLIFLDGNKERYHDYFNVLDRLLAPRGLLVVDDVFFHGDVLNLVPRTEKGAGVQKLLDKVERLAGYHKAILPVSNGMLLLIKQD